MDSVGTRKKVVLFDANVDYIGIPWGLLQTTALVDTTEYDIRIITCRDYPDYEKEILKHCEGAVCVGISCVTSKYIRNGLRVSRAVKERYPDLPIMWGGWQAITLPRVTLENPYVDYVCLGQGERIFSEFLAALTSGDSTVLRAIKGLGYKFGGEVVLNECRPIENPDTFPIPNLDLVPLANHTEAGRWGVQRSIAVMTSVGCPYRCGFCCEQNFCHRIWLGSSPDHLMTLLGKIKEHVDYDAIKIGDSNFFANEQRVVDICQRLIDGKCNVRLVQANGRTNTLLRYKESTWQLLKTAGLASILVGSESADNETLKFINKDATFEQTLELCRIAKRHGIALFLSNVIGFPKPEYFTQDPAAVARKEFKELYAFYKEAAIELGIDVDFGTFFFTPFPASPLFDESVRNGFVPPQTLDEWADYELTEVNVPWLRMARVDRRRLEMFRYICRLFGSDSASYIRQLPIFVRVPSMLIDRTAKAVARFRLRVNFLSCPVDQYCMEGLEALFRRVNNRVRMLNITKKTI